MGANQQPVARIAFAAEVESCFDARWYVNVHGYKNRRYPARALTIRLGHAKFSFIISAEMTNARAVAGAPLVPAVPAES